jgi:hypothetical protein
MRPPTVNCTASKSKSKGGNKMQIRPSFPKDLELTVRKNGGILLHQRTVDQLGLMGTKFVDLNLDPVETILEIKPSIDESDAPYRACKQKSGALLILGKTFLDKMGILYSEGSRVLQVEWNPVKRRIVAKLS